MEEAGKTGDCLADCQDPDLAKKDLDPFMDAGASQAVKGFTKSYRVAG